MNKNELIDIINKYYSYDDVPKAKLNVDINEHFDFVIVSPTWKPHFVFDDEYKVTNLKQGTTSTFKLEYKGKKLLFLKTGKGAPNLCDNLFLLYNVDAPFIFLGSAGSLNEKIKMGDIVIPNYSISGDGASLYFSKDFPNTNMFEKVFHNEVLKKQIEQICNEKKYISKDGIVYSTDTLIGEYYHLKEIIQMGASCIEQETASFGKCMNIMEKKGVPILVISDSPVSGTNFYEPLDNKEKYLETRTKKLQKVISSLF